MANLPDIVPMPDALGAGSATLRDEAEWASTFARSDTSLAQRVRGNQKVEAYTRSLIGEQKAELQGRIRSDKAAQDLYFGTKKLEMAEREAGARQEERDARMKHAEELQPELIASRQAATSASTARERALTSTAAAKSSLDLAEAQDTAGFSRAISEGLAKGVKLGTPEYSTMAMQARITYPGVAKDLADDVWKGSRSAMTLEDSLAAFAQAKQSAGESASVAVGPNGVRITQKPASDSFEKDRAFLAGQNEKAKNRRRLADKQDKGDLDGSKRQALIDDADADIMEYTARLNALGERSAPAAAPVSVATAADYAKIPSGGVFIDPKGVRRTKP